MLEQAEKSGDDVFHVNLLPEESPTVHIPVPLYSDTLWKSALTQGKGNTDDLIRTLSSPSESVHESSTVLFGCPTFSVTAFPTFGNGPCDVPTSDPSVDLRNKANISPNPRDKNTPLSHIPCACDEDPPSSAPSDVSFRSFTAEAPLGDHYPYDRVISPAFERSSLYLKEYSGSSLCPASGASQNEAIMSRTPFHSSELPQHNYFTEVSNSSLGSGSCFTSPSVSSAGNFQEHYGLSLSTVDRSTQICESAYLPSTMSVPYAEHYCQTSTSGNYPLLAPSHTFVPPIFPISIPMPSAVTRVETPDKVAEIQLVRPQPTNASSLGAAGMILPQSCFPQNVGFAGDSSNSQLFSKAGNYSEVYKDSLSDGLFLQPSQFHVAPSSGYAENLSVSQPCSDANNAQLPNILGPDLYFEGLRPLAPCHSGPGLGQTMDPALLGPVHSDPPGNKTPVPKVSGTARCMTSIASVIAEASLGKGVGQKDAGGKLEWTKFTCRECQAKYDTLTELNKHFKDQHIEPAKSKGVASAGVCAGRDKNRETLRRKFQCQFCPSSFSKENLLKIHEVVHSKETAFTCEDCDIIFSHLEDYTKHKQVHRRSMYWNNTCADAMSPVEKVRKNSCSFEQNEKTCSKEKPYECSTCRKCFHLLSTLKSHQILHTGQRPYECEVCGAKFSQKTTLRRHNSSHLNTKDFSCCKCNAKVKSVGSLRRHERLHRTLVECQKCNREFRNPRTLAKHMATHVDMEQMPLGCLQCSSEFSSRKALLQHIKRVHMKSFDFGCGECGAAFSRKDDFERHKKVHVVVDKSMAVSCKMCGCHFKFLSSLGKHMKKHSSVDVCKVLNKPSKKKASNKKPSGGKKGCTGRGNDNNIVRNSSVKKTCFLLGTVGTIGFVEVENIGKDVPQTFCDTEIPVQEVDVG